MSKLKFSNLVHMYVVTSVSLGVA